MGDEATEPVRFNDVAVAVVEAVGRDEDERAGVRLRDAADGTVREVEEVAAAGAVDCEGEAAGLEEASDA